MNTQSIPQIPSMQEIERQAKWFARLIVVTILPDRRDVIRGYGQYVASGLKPPTKVYTRFMYQFVRIEKPGYEQFVALFNDNHLAISGFEDAIARHVWEMTQTS